MHLAEVPSLHSRARVALIRMQSTLHQVHGRPVQLAGAVGSMSDNEKASQNASTQHVNIDFQ